MSDNVSVGAVLEIARKIIELVASSNAAAPAVEITSGFQTEALRSMLALQLSPEILNNINFNRIDGMDVSATTIKFKLKPPLAAQRMGLK